MCAVCPKFNYQEHLKQSGCECFESNVNSSRNVFLVDLRCCKQGIRPLNSYRYLYVTEQVRLCESIMVASAKRVRITPRERKGGSMGEILRTRKRHRSDYLKVRKAHKNVKGLNSQFIFYRWKMTLSFWLQTRGQRCVRMTQVRTGAVQTSWSRSKTSNLTVMMKNQ